jgi:hypothetical protein
MAVARPIPEPAPVTMTTCPSNRLGVDAVLMWMLLIERISHPFGCPCVDALNLHVDG